MPAFARRLEGAAPRATGVGDTAQSAATGDVAAVLCVAAPDPLATAAVGVYTTPLFIAVLASAIGEEQLTRGSWAAIGLGFGGVLLVLRPGLGVFSLAMTLPVAAACCYAGAMVLTRRHCARERPLVLALGLNLCFALAGVAGSGLVAMWVDDQALPRGFLSRPWQPLDLAEAA